MGGPKAPEDNSDKVARIEAQAQREARAAEERKKAQELADFQRRLGGAYDTGIQGASDYFEQQGVNSKDFMSAITSRANALRGSVPQLDAAPGSYFANLGQLVYDAETAAARNKASRGINQLAPDGFSRNRIADTSDDAIIDSILGENQTKAQDYVENLLKRGVITEGGKAAALDNISRQALTGRGRLNEIGNAELSRGRTALDNLVLEGRNSASNLQLGNNFDITGLGDRLGTSTNDFFAGLGDRLRAATPGDLFDTAGLANIAGAAQGAGNTAFNPQAVGGGIFDDEEEDDPIGSTNPF